LTVTTETAVTRCFRIACPTALSLWFCRLCKKGPGPDNCCGPNVRLIQPKANHSRIALMFLPTRVINGQDRNPVKELHDEQAIREEDPARLSSIDHSYRGDIDTIVGKALEKDKTRRYASAADLAGGIRRYLTDEPIVARIAEYELTSFRNSQGAKGRSGGKGGGNSGACRRRRGQHMAGATRNAGGEGGRRGAQQGRCGSGGGRLSTSSFRMIYWRKPAHPTSLG
jgi:hypothetical protein